MELYFTISRIPEMANLSRPQRRFVKSQCVFWLFRRLPFRLGSWAVTVACIMFGSYLAGTLRWGFWKSGLVTVASLAVLGHLYDMVWIAHWRAEVGRFIKLHEAEIKAVA